MEQELNQVIQAILIASDPSQGSFHQQALDYISNIQQNASDTWRLALTLFVEAGPDGVRKYPLQARFFALRILDDFLDNRFEALDDDCFRTLQQSLMRYIQSEYLYGSAEASAPFLRNKFSHTLTLFFLATYVEQWPTFFVDLFALMRPAEASSQSSFNPHVSLLFFHIVLEISGEVADQIIKSARQYNSVRHARDARVRDAVRERDAARINEAVLTIIADSADRMAKLQKGEIAPTSERETTDVIEVVDWGIRTSDLMSALAIRLATSGALLRIVSKGLKEPGDKLQLIKVLSLGQVLEALEERTRAEQANRGLAVDEGEETYREALGRLLNILGLELLKIADECTAEDVRSEASRLLNQILPVMLHFMADEYDDTCSTIFPMVQAILGSYKRSRKTSSEPIDTEKRSFLTSLLGVILTKMKWDEDTDMDDMDDEDKAAFEGLRKDLRSFMDSVLSIDQDLVTETVRKQALATLTAYQNGVPVKWHDAELAIYLVYIFGEINKTGGKGRSAFCQAPAVVAKEKRKETDYSSFPLTVHGEMIFALIQSGISAYPNRTVVMQFFETVVRYGDFFKVRKECIVPTLESMVGARGLHSTNSSVRTRVFYLFHRFIKEGRNDISPELSGTLLEGIRDVLTIEVDLPELESPEQDMLTEAIKNSGVFDAQLYLFETVGTLISLFWKSREQSAALLMSFVKPLLDELSINLQSIKGPQDVVPILKVHHVIMALGNIAKGFPDYPSPLPEGYTLPPLDVFRDVAQAILMSLEAMNVFKVVRDATRFAFARILATTGPNVTHFIPPLMANLLAHFEPSELVDFMNFINLLIHKLQQDLFDVLDELIGPLTAHITGILSQPVSGTDDELSHADIKKAYLALLNNILSSKLQGIFISSRNKDRFEPLLETMLQLAGDVSDPISEKAAFIFLGRSVSVWGQPSTANGDSAVESRRLPGFERFVYENVVPAAFRVLSLPELNIKDGQILVVLHEIANLLQIIGKTRGQEAYEFFVSVFLPAQNWPPDTAIEFTTKLRDLDNKSFRKYFSDFVRASRSGS
ncbi:hypothetical protein EW146_g6092 [Bondarzewia mesenterica]|uniref:Exportin-T n=1 Tax=Bondarzewia mesenterica TaxID=1095465 RepID=A0A4S4LPL6_9AGAM|nr:hypothetical protein EW146_g6092 [Bondarzewia mesenterica]